MNTINKSFNEAWSYLEKCHPEKDPRTRHIAYGTWLRLDRRHVGVKTKREWAYYFHQLTAIIIIGKRNKWINQETGEGGSGPWFFVPDEAIAKHRKES